MSSLDFFIAGDPVPQPRPQGQIRQGREGAFIHIYTPSNANEWKRAVRRAGQKAAGDTICTGPLRLCLRFFVARPEYHSDRGGLKASAPTYHDKENMDIDNLTKAVMDALTPMRVKDPTPAQAWGLWTGDGLVSQLFAEKLYAGPQQPCGCRVMVTGVIPDHAPEGLFAQDATA